MTIAILIVDDEEHKSEQISNAFANSPIRDLVTIHRSQTAHAAAQVLTRADIDLMILDIQLPQREGDEAKEDGGLRFLEAMQVFPNIRRPHLVVGLTAYDSSYHACSDFFANHGWPLLRFRHESTEWCTAIFNLVIHLAESRSQKASAAYDKDLAIITALERPELTQVLELPASWAQSTFSEDDTIYHLGHFSKASSGFRVVACTAAQMGMPAAAALAMKVIHRFRPRYLAMCGIAAGIGGNYGDILVADQSWDYGSGKSKFAPPLGWSILSPFASVSFEPAPVPILVSNYLHARLQYFGSNYTSLLQEIRSAWSALPPPPTPLKIRIGPLASGAAVLENAPLLREIKRHNRKLIGIEMEAYALFMAARLAPEPKPHVFVAKSICDFADHRKDDRWQDYSAYTSAQFIYHFARTQLSAEARAGVV